MAGALQGGQDIVHTGQAGAGAGQGPVHPPLQDVEARPASDMGALQRGRDSRGAQGKGSVTQLRWHSPVTPETQPCSTSEKTPTLI